MTGLKTADAKGATSTDLNPIRTPQDSPRDPLAGSSEKAKSQDSRDRRPQKDPARHGKAAECRTPRMRPKGPTGGRPPPLQGVSELRGLDTRPDGEDVSIARTHNLDDLRRVSIAARELGVFKLALCLVEGRLCLCARGVASVFDA